MVSKNNCKKYTEESLREIVKNCITYRQVLLKFGRNDSSWSYRVLKNKLQEWNIDVSHFYSFKEYAKLMYNQGRLIKKTNEEIFCENSKVGRATAKRRLLEQELLPHECSECGQPPEWRGKRLPIILDHINGVRDDNRIENLRLLCPNCDSIQKTFCKGAAGLAKPKKKERKKRKYHARPDQRKVERPPLKVLLKEIESMGYVQTGKKYGVSDNAIRKWIKK